TGTNTGTTVGGLSLNGVYYVIVVDDRTIRLSVAQNAANLNFTPSGVSGSNITISNPSTLTDLNIGAAVVYNAPQPKIFTSSQVDVVGTGSPADLSDRAGNDNLVFLDSDGNAVAHNLSNGN